jgi:hypothetical protein
MIEIFINDKDGVAVPVTAESVITINKNAGDETPLFYGSPNDLVKALSLGAECADFIGSLRRAFRGGK